MARKTKKKMAGRKTESAYANVDPDNQDFYRASKRYLQQVQDRIEMEKDTKVNGPLRNHEADFKRLRVYELTEKKLVKIMKYLEGDATPDMFPQEK